MTNTVAYYQKSPNEGHKDEYELMVIDHELGHTVYVGYVMDVMEKK